jgi:hypothetical protein
MLATFAGERQILIFDAAGAAGSNPETGQQLWRYPWKSQSGINAAQPAVAGPNKLFISSVDGGALVEVAYSDDTWTATPVWENRNLKSYFANPIVLGPYIYGLDLGILVCLDVETGKRLWKGGRYGHGQILPRNEGNSGHWWALSEDPVQPHIRQMASIARLLFAPMLPISVDQRFWHSRGPLRLRASVDESCAGY